MRLAVCPFFSDTESYYLIPESVAQALEDIGFIKSVPQFEFILPGQVLVQHPSQTTCPELRSSKSMSKRVQVPEGCEVTIRHGDHEERASATDWIVGTRVHPAGGEAYSSLGVIPDNAMQRMADTFEAKEVNIHNHKI